MSEMTKQQLLELAKAQKDYADQVGKTVQERQKEIAIARELLKSVKERVLEEYKDKKTLDDRINLQLRLLDLREQETKQLEKSIEANEQLLGEQDKNILALEQAIERKKSLSEEDQNALEARREENETLEHTLGRLKDQQKLTETFKTIKDPTRISPSHQRPRRLDKKTYWNDHGRKRGVERNIYRPASRSF